MKSSNYICASLTTSVTEVFAILCITDFKWYKIGNSLYIGVVNKLGDIIVVLKLD